MGSSHNWLKSYVSNRSISVTSGSTSSSIVILWCSTWVLGPILFTIYVSPIALNCMLTIHNSFSSFPLHLFLAVFAVSSGVSSLHSWFLHNGLVLNPTKVEGICFGTNPRLKSLSSLTSFEVAGSFVPLVNHVKLLGVTIDNHLNFDHHISNVCTSSYFHICALI